MHHQTKKLDSNTSELAQSETKKELANEILNSQNEKDIFSESFKNDISSGAITSKETLENIEFGKVATFFFFFSFNLFSHLFY